MSRLVVHSISIEDDDNGICFDGYAVYDMLADLYRFISLQHSRCNRWIEQNEHDYPDPDEDDDLS